MVLYLFYFHIKRNIKPVGMQKKIKFHSVTNKKEGWGCMIEGGREPWSSTKIETDGEIKRKTEIKRETSRKF